MQLDHFTYLPRKCFHIYLKNFIHQQLDRLSSMNIKYQIIIEEVTNLVKIEHYFKLTTKTNQEFYTKKVVLCTGHGNSQLLHCNKKFSKILNLNHLKRSINPQSKILIKGMGLVMFDIISELTEGFGGKFIKSLDDNLIYIPSGLEPKIYLYSRSGLPLSGKGCKNSLSLPHKPQFFTINNIHAIIESKDNLDFDEDFLPLLLKEVTYRFEEIEGVGSFNVDHFFYPQNYISKNNYHDFYHQTVEYIVADLKACKKGIFQNGTKAAGELIRDLRDNLRLCIEQKKLSSLSHQKFLNHWNVIFNKICVGPPHFRIEQLLALIDSKVVSLEVAYNPQIMEKEDKFFAVSNFTNGQANQIDADYFIEASIPEVEHVVESSPLWMSLDSVSLFNNKGYRTGGVDIDDSSRVKNISGNVYHDGLYAFGIPTEGSKYFTYVLPRPDIPSTFLKDSNIIAEHIIKSLTH